MTNYFKNSFLFFPFDSLYSWQIETKLFKKKKKKKNAIYRRYEFRIPACAMKSTSENRMHMEGEACLRVNTSSLATPDDDEPEPRNGSPRLDNRSWNAFCAVDLPSNVLETRRIHGCSGWNGIKDVRRLWREQMLNDGQQWTIKRTVCLKRARSSSFFLFFDTITRVIKLWSSSIFFRSSCGGFNNSIVSYGHYLLLVI